ncbi:hypothetical protein ILUMI_10749 [Ignelater luminosus]|uniref:Uncharacterized protein n=1 Tax=Ignelater luminosus TaxID=2038154 RepID=A0A8K0D1T7_IGNLU|nr:hypothetical protein ILUMI_10749 [Ignelater luminosus]
MHSLNNELPWSLEYVPPSADYLLNYKIEDSNLDIEIGLGSPHDQKVFLSASMAFLQNQLLKRLKYDIYSRFQRRYYIPEKTYSDLLLVERNSKCKREKYFIRLKNIDEYDKILKDEACTPHRLLSLKTILPVPKKHSWIKSIRSRISRRFKSRLSIVTEPKYKNFFNIFNILRRIDKHKQPNLPEFMVLESHEDHCDKHSKINTLELRGKYCFPCTDSLQTSNPSLESFLSLEVNPTLSSLAINRIKMAPSFVKPSKSSKGESKLLFVYSSSDSTQDFFRGNGDHRRKHEVVKYTTKKPVRYPPFTKRIYEMKTYNYINRNFSTTSYETLELSSDTTINVLTKCNAQTQLFRQQSKLSVSIDDESHSEDDEDEKLLNCRQVSSYSSDICTNFTDELKSKFSSGYLHTLIMKHLVNSSRLNEKFVR